MRKVIYILLLLQINLGYTQEYISFLDKLSAYQKNIKISLLERNNGYITSYRIDTNTFNGEEYMQIFNKLKLHPDYKLGCAYHCAGIGGEPFLYVLKREINFDSILNSFTLERIEKHEYRYKEFEKRLNDWLQKKNVEEDSIKKYNWLINSVKQTISRENKYGYYYSEFNYAFDTLNHPKYFLEPEPSEMGYLQWLVFNKFGDVFAYFWHTNDRYKYIIYKHEQINDFIEQNQKARWGIELDESEARKLLSIDISPKVEFDFEQSKCIIYIYEFRPRRELVKNKYSIECKYPYTIELLETNIILETKINAIF